MPARETPSPSRMLRACLRFWPVLATLGSSSTGLAASTTSPSESWLCATTRSLADRHIDHIVAIDAEGESHRVGVHEPSGTRLHAQRKVAGGLRLGQKLVQRSQAVHHGVLAGELHSAPAAEFLGPGLKVEALEQLDQPFRVGLAGCKVGDAELEFEVAANRRQLPRHGQRFQRTPQVLPHLALHLVGASDHVVQGSELRQPLGGGLGPHLGHAGDVVHGVAHERQIVGDARWGERRICPPRRPRRGWCRSWCSPASRGLRRAAPCPCRRWR